MQTETGDDERARAPETPGNGRMGDRTPTSRRTGNGPLEAGQVEPRGQIKPLQIPHIPIRRQLRHARIRRSGARFENVLVGRGTSEDGPVAQGSRQKRLARQAAFGGTQDRGRKICEIVVVRDPTYGPAP